MRIYGIDFSSTPSRRKPITCAECELRGARLHIIALTPFPSLADFESLLASPGPWIAGCDFPFSQPRRFVEAMGWPTRWSDLVEYLGQRSRAEFKTDIKRYCDAQPPGDKHHSRATDKSTGAKSPMMTVRVPVGLMFHEGAPRLARSSVSIVPCRPTDDSRTVLEVYPGLAARKLIGRTPYKNDSKKPGEEERRAARQDLVMALSRPSTLRGYGIGVALHDKRRYALIDDPKGDWLDAVLCALQAAWAYRQPDRCFGVPPDVDRLEGWIVDPATTIG